MTPRLPPSPRIEHGRITCVVSDSHGFVVPLIAKNASSTLRAELARPAYASRELLWSKLEPGQRQYRAHVFIREPVERFLSAFYEITRRVRNGERTAPRPATGTGGIEGVRTLLGQLRQRGFFDPHLESQCHYLERFSADETTDVRELARGVDAIRLDAGLAPLDQPLPRLRPRVEGRDTDAIVHERDLPDDVRAEIRSIYHDDLAMYAHHVDRPTTP